jgi:hypothetical protein
LIESHIHQRRQLVTGPLVGALFANPEVRAPTRTSPAAPAAPTNSA